MTAQLFPIPLVAPGFRGLNKSQAGALLGPDWATELKNVVFDNAGRVALRKGWADQTDPDISSTPDIDQMAEFVKSDETVEVILAAGNNLYSGISNPTDKTGTLTPSGDDWQFLNFNDKIIGIQDGETPIVYTGTGNFADIVAGSGSLPTGGIGASVFGRLWIVDSDGVTIKYSGLLDETDWGSASAGSIDMKNVWTSGTDSVQAITGFGGHLVVFGKNHIVFWADGQGNVLGLDPTNMIVMDTIEGTGCIARDTVQSVGEGDVWFLSRNGVQSLQRALTNKANPVDTISKNISRYLKDFVDDEDATKIRSTWNPVEKFYLLLLPTSSRIFCFDGPFLMEDGSARVTEWDQFTSKSLLTRRDNTLLFGFDGKVGKYQGYLDNASAYRLVYQSPWLDMGPELNSRTKIFKSVRVLNFAAPSHDLVVKWGFDFNPNQFSISKTFSTSASAEWSISEWNLGEWSGGTILRASNFPAKGTGQYIQVTLETEANNSAFAIQQIDLINKLGRLV